MRNIHRLFATLSAVAVISGVLDARPAAATNIFDSGSLSTCTTPNCGSRVIAGTVLLSSNFAVPWTVEIGARQGECLRLDVTQQAVNLEAVLIGPHGIVWRNDDRTPGVDLRPLIKVNSLPRNGWYTLQVSQASGLPVNTDFTLAFGRYPSNNPNCLPTTPGF